MLCFFEPTVSHNESSAKKVTKSENESVNLHGPCGASYDKDFFLSTNYSTMKSISGNSYDVLQIVHVWAVTCVAAVWLPVEEGRKFHFGLYFKALRTK